MYFQLVDNQVLSTQGRPDVNLHRLTTTASMPPARRSTIAFCPQMPYTLSVELNTLA